MSERHLNSLPRIKRLCFWGKWLALVSAVLLCVWTVFLAIYPEELVAAVMSNVDGTIEIMPAATVRLLAWAVALLPTVLLAYVLILAARLFALVAKGEYLSEATRALMLRMGKLAFVASVLDVVCKSIAVLLLSSANPEGKRLLSISVTSEQFSGVILGILLLMFAALLAEMAAIDEDNKGFL
jgi:hypothetical protein